MNDITVNPQKCGLTPSRSDFGKNAFRPSNKPFKNHKRARHNEEDAEDFVRSFITDAHNNVQRLTVLFMAVKKEFTRSGCV